MGKLCSEGGQYVARRHDQHRLAHGPVTGPATGSVRASSPNEAAIDAIRARHAQLSWQLHVHPNAVVTAARTGECGRERDALHNRYRTELMPHVVAEEHALYSPGLDGMDEILGYPHDGAAHDDCGCDHDAGEAQDAPPQISTQPEELPMSTQPEEAEGDLDVRTLPHGQRHEIIFARLDQLQPGQALVIVNDHDPKPLRYQTAAMWPDRFVWSYLQAGPQIWRVAISRAG